MSPAPTPPVPDLLSRLEAVPLPPPPAIAAPGAAPGVDRYAWRLEPSARALVVDVFEALPGHRGWRTGRRIHLVGLPEPGQSAWAEVGAREREAIQALRAWHQRPASPVRARRNPSGLPDGLPLALLSKLEGHPHLLWAEGSGDPGSPVILQREVCALMVREAEGGWQLSLTLRPGSGQGQLRRDGDRALLTGFAPLHLALDACLGEGGWVTAKDRPRLARFLGRLAPHLPLLTDLAPEPAPPAERPEARLRVWLKGGHTRLDVDLTFRVAANLPLQAPGEGCRFVVAGPPAARTLRTRDLAFEGGRASQVKALLPPGTKAGPEGGWRIDGRDAVLGFLAGLRDLGNRVQVEGLPGLCPSLPRKVEEGDLELDLRPLRGGFEARGRLLGRPLESLLGALRQGGRFADLGDGSVLDLAGLLGGKLRGLGAWGREGKGVVNLPAAALILFQGLEDRMTDARARARILALDTTPDQPPATFQGELRAYQREGFRWMARLLGAGLGACLADDMGLGKTVQTAALLLLRAQEGPSLVLAPTSVGPNWKAELARFAPSLDVRLLGEVEVDRALADLGPGCLVIASYGRLLGSGEPLLDVDWGTVVLDEAHAIKNPASRRAQASRQIRAKGRLALTGTPVENHPEELASLLSWLLPDLAPRLEGKLDLETLRAMASPFLLRRLKKDVLKELPPRTDVTVWVEPSDTEVAFHRDLLAKVRQEAEAGTTVHVLAALMKLRRACAHPALVDPAYRGPASKVDLLMDRLATLREEGHRSLVFSQFTDMLDRVRQRLREAGIPFRHLDGSTPAKARAAEVAAFQAGEGEVFLISLKAGGVGLNLTAADDVFHLDPWWNPAVEDQASDRAHRMGRTRPVTIHRLVMRDSVEARVLALHDRKRAMVAELLEGRDLPVTLDRETLVGLLGG